MEVLDAALSRYPEILAVMVTGFGGVTEAVSAMKRGAADFLIKPFQIASCPASSRRYGTAAPPPGKRRAPAQLRDRYRFDSVVGQSGAMQPVFQTLELVAPMNSTVLIHGETGTGKELIARTIHHNSPRADQPFVAFNCAAIPEPLAEAELFGHARARSPAPSPPASASSSRPTAGRCSSTKSARCRWRCSPSCCASCRSAKSSASAAQPTSRCPRRRRDQPRLRKMVKEGTFREDLYYRLNVIPITLPPLRERREDIPLLARHFVLKSCRSNGLPQKSLTQDAVRVLMNYSWPGNIRQIENAVEHAVAMTGQEKEIPARSLPEDILQPASSLLLPTVAIPDEGINFTSVVSQLERELIVRCLEKTGGNKRQAARLLQLSHTTLIDKLHRLNLGDEFPAAS